MKRLLFRWKIYPEAGSLKGDFLKKNKNHIIILLCFAVIAGILALDVWRSSNSLISRVFSCTNPKVTGKVKLVVLSDLHDREFGEDNQNLIQMVLSQTPDLVLMDGDMLNSHSADAEIPCSLIRSLSQKVPVYYALGNHEKMYMEQHDPERHDSKQRNPELVSKLEEAGAKVLDKEYEDIEIRGVKLRLGGMFDYAFALDADNTASKTPEVTRRFLEDFQNTDRMKIMMCHRPDSFIFGDAASYWDVDLVISGHNHGGQVVLPFVGGLYGGDQGWFPEYVHGMYQKENIELFVTSGLGSDGQMLPRMNNRPEVAVLTLGNTTEE